jgi:serine/threonine protein kinase
VIDKGSFGKVFLVENSKNGKVYAMKRLNKDVVLQKNQVDNIKVEKEILFDADHPFVNSMDYVF